MKYKSFYFYWLVISMFFILGGPIGIGVRILICAPLFYYILHNKNRKFISLLFSYCYLFSFIVTGVYATTIALETNILHTSTMFHHIISILLILDLVSHSILVDSNYDNIIKRRRDRNEI